MSSLHSSPPSVRLNSEPHMDPITSSLLPIPANLFPRVAELGSVEEDWTGITEQSKRRRLQNRLNQRARRQRLQYSVVHQHDLSTKTSKATEEPGEVVPISKTQAIASTTVVRCRLRRPGSQALLQDFANQAIRSYQLGTPNVIQLADTVRLNVFRAFANNVKILGFDEAWLTDDAISPFNTHGSHTGSDYPETMRPTPLQVSVEHHPWIDLFPCPRMRDNFLSAVLIQGEDAVDEDGLCHDVVDPGDSTDVDTAIIAWADPWAPHGWEVTESFLRKWGWLLHGCVELQAGTNAWRQRRGLGLLRFPGC